MLDERDMGGGAEGGFEGGSRVGKSIPNAKKLNKSHIKPYWVITVVKDYVDIVNAFSKITSRYMYTKH